MNPSLASASPSAAERARPGSVRIEPARLEVRYRRLEPSHPLLGEDIQHQRRSIVIHRAPVLLRHRGCLAFVANASVLVLLRPGDRYTLEPLGSVVEELRFDLSEDSSPGSLSIAALEDQLVQGTPFVPLRSRAFLDVYLRNRLRRILEVPQALAGTVLRAAETGARDALALDAGPATRPALGEEHCSLVERTRRRLTETYTDVISAEALAEELGCSLCHLCRRFRAETGSTLRAYRAQLRVREAAARLVDGAYSHDSLAHLSEAMGYCTHSHFSAAFRRAFGMTPFQLRRVVRQASN